MKSESDLYNLYFCKIQKFVEMPGFEPGASYMRSKRSTAELHPQSLAQAAYKIVELHHI